MRTDSPDLTKKEHLLLDPKVSPMWASNGTSFYHCIMDIGSVCRATSNPTKGSEEIQCSN